MVDSLGLEVQIAESLIWLLGLKHGFSGTVDEVSL